MPSVNIINIYISIEKSCQFMLHNGVIVVHCDFRKMINWDLSHCDNLSQLLL